MWDFSSCDIFALFHCNEKSDNSFFRSTKSGAQTSFHTLYVLISQEFNLFIKNLITWVQKVYLKNIEVIYISAVFRKNW